MRNPPDRFRLYVIPAAAVFLLLATVGFAEPLNFDRLAADFRPVTGQVILQSEGEFVIDLDQADGVLVGDIFAVLGQGESVVHPETGKVIGTLEATKGLLKVTRVREGYSMSRPIAGGGRIEKADPVRRFQEMKAMFWDYTEQGRLIYGKIASTLPDLKWIDYESAQQARPEDASRPALSEPAIFFIFDGRHLEVRDPEFALIRRYEMTEAGAPVVAAPLPEVPAEPRFQEVRTIASFPETITMSDFLQIDGRLLMCATDGTAITVRQVGESIDLIAEARPPYPGRVLAVRWWAPEASAWPHVAVTFWSDDQLESLLYRLKDGDLSPVAERIPRSLGTLDIDGNGLPETLLGQDFDAESFFGSGIKVIEIRNQDLKYLDPPLKLPQRFPVIGGLLCGLSRENASDAVFVRNSLMYVYDGRKLLYKSGKNMGGSISFLTYDINPDFKNAQPTSAVFEIDPVAVDLDGDSRLEVLAVASERDILGTVGAAPGIRKSWLSVVKYQNGRFVEGKLGDEFSRPIQGMTVQGGRILLVSSPQPGLVPSGEGSHLLAYRLSR